MAASATTRLPGLLEPLTLAVMPLKIGDLAPDFDLRAAIGDRTDRIRLSDYRGSKHVVVTFHPLDWTPT